MPIDPGVPILPGHHQHTIPQAGRIGVQGAACLGKGFLFGLLTLGVDFRQTGRNYRWPVLHPHRAAVSGPRQHCSSALPAFQTRCQAVTDRVGGDRFAGIPAALQQRLQAGAHGILQQGQALPAPTHDFLPQGASHRPPCPAPQTRHTFPAVLRDHSLPMLHTA